ncbi:MAG: hypothetical protein ABEI97_00625, partial [Candidatus Nanohaloarchaea archaeon]
MRCTVLLSEEHAELPEAELAAALDADGIDASIEERHAALVFLDGEDVAPVADRLALSFEISEHLHTFDPENYQKLAAQD